jgi:hypothetical protein
MGKLKMVEKNGQMVPFYAADGKGKMMYGGSKPMMKMGGVLDSMMCGGYTSSKDKKISGKSLRK